MSKNSWNAFTKNMFMLRFPIYCWLICLFWYLFFCSFLIREVKTRIGIVYIPFWSKRFGVSLLHTAQTCLSGGSSVEANSLGTDVMTTAVSLHVFAIMYIYLHGTRWPSNPVSDNIEHRSQTCLVWAALDLTLCDSTPVRAQCCFQK